MSAQCRATAAPLPAYLHPLGSHFADGRHPFLTASTTLGGGKITATRVHLKKPGCLLLDGCDTSASCATRHRGARAGGNHWQVGRQLAAQLVAGRVGRRVLAPESLISFKPMQVIPIIHVKNKPAWLPLSSPSACIQRVTITLADLQGDHFFVRSGLAQH